MDAHINPIKRTRGLNESEVRMIVQEELVDLRNEIAADLKKITARITKDVLKSVEDYISESRDENKQQLIDINTTITNQIALRNREQVAVRQMTKDLSIVLGKQIQSTVMKEIDTKIMPKLENMNQMINYANQDGGEIVTEYRRAVEAQSRAGNTKLIGDSSGKSARSWAGGEVRMFFDD